MAVLEQINTYPIKALASQRLSTVELVKACGIPGDRQFALTLDTTIDGSTWHSSRSFLINALNDGLLRISVDGSGSNVSLTGPGEHGLTFDTDDQETLDAINKELPGLLSLDDPANESPRIVKRQSDGGPAGFWDFQDSQISIMNIASLHAVSQALGQRLDIDRFRGNLIISDLPAWSEFGFAGFRFRLGEAELEFTRPVRRCAATAVNPISGVRDIPVNRLLAEQFGHGYFGMYGQVVRSGAISKGDVLKRIGPAKTQSSEAMVQGAGDYALWPKLAVLEKVMSAGSHIELSIASNGCWPLIAGESSGSLKLHIGPGSVIRGRLVKRNSGSSLEVVCEDASGKLNGLKPKDLLVVTGPFGR